MGYAAAPVRPTLTIVMPSYQQAPFLEEAIRSVLVQGDAVSQFIVLDGGSTDGSREIIERYAGSIDHWRCERDAGQAAAIAEGLAMATGEVITWLNSDDALLPGAAEAMLARFAADPALGLVEGDTVVVDAESRIVRCDRRAGPSARWMRHGYMRIHQPSTFFRRSVYEAVGGLDDSLHCVMDTDLWYRILPAARAERLERYVGVHRVHEAAKGEASGWERRYRAEREQLAERYPAIYGRPLHYHLGRVAYYADRLRTGRGRRAKADTRAWRGRPLADVFPAPADAPA
jgi:glycosyltransferase involved in cell wall biosynthesis